MREMFSTRQVERDAGVQQERLEIWCSRMPILHPDRIGATRIWSGGQRAAAIAVASLRRRGVPLRDCAPAADALQAVDRVDEARAVAKNLAVVRFKRGVRYPVWRTIDVDQLDALRRADAIESAISIGDCLEPRS